VTRRARAEGAASGESGGGPAGERYRSREGQPAPQRQARKLSSPATAPRVSRKGQLAPQRQTVSQPAHKRPRLPKSSHTPGDVGAAL